MKDSQNSQADLAGIQDSKRGGVDKPGGLSSGIMAAAEFPA